MMESGVIDVNGPNSKTVLVYGPDERAAGSARPEGCFEAVLTEAANIFAMWSIRGVLF